MASIEEWRSVSTHPCSYEVSTFGRVRSVPRINRAFSRKGAVYVRALKGKILRATLSQGYPQVTLWSDHKARIVRVHVLVLEAFAGPRPCGFYGCHRDGDPMNNCISNLYWGSPKQNSADAARHGTRRMGERLPWSRLSEEDVLRIRAMSGFVPQGDIAALFGVRQSHVSRIINGHTWRHVDASESTGREAA